MSSGPGDRGDETDGDGVGDLDEHHRSLWRGRLRCSRLFFANRYDDVGVLPRRGCRKRGDCPVVAGGRADIDLTSRPSSKPSALIPALSPLTVGLPGVNELFRRPTR